MAEPSTVASSTHRPAAWPYRSPTLVPAAASLIETVARVLQPAASRRRAAMPPSASNTTRWAALTVRSLTS